MASESGAALRGCFRIGVARITLGVVALTATRAEAAVVALPISVAVSTFGAVNVSWAAISSAASYSATVAPFALTYSWTTPFAQLPDPTQWVLDNRQNVTASGFGFNSSGSSPQLMIWLSGASSCLGGSLTATTACPMMYRRLPPSPTLDVQLTLPPPSTSSAMTVFVGILVYNAYTNAPLAICGLQARGPTNRTFGLWSNQAGAWVGSAFSVPSDAAAWGSSAYVRLRRDSAAATFDCAGKTLGSTPWLGAATVTAASASFDSFSEGDLYYGLAATTSGGNKSTNLTANFGALRIGTQLSTLAAPVDPNTGADDACFVGSAITPVTSVTGNTSFTVITGLPVNFPLVVNVTALDANGFALAQSAVYPFFYARPLPPGWEALSLFLDAKYLPQGSTLSNLYDASPTRQLFAATASPLTSANFPTATSSTFTGGAGIMRLNRAYATGFVSQFYYGAINNYPLDPNGVVGLRARDYTGASAGAYFSAGKTRTTPQVYNFVTQPTVSVPSVGGPNAWYRGPTVYGALDGFGKALSPGFFGTPNSTNLTYPIHKSSAPSLLVSQ